MTKASKEEEQQNLLAYWMEEGFELKVLDELCKEGKAHSSVQLTADLYGRVLAEANQDPEKDGYRYRSLEWTLIESILEDLNKKGLVVYTIGQFDIFVRIRPTRKAYELLHIGRTWRTEVGHRVAGYHRDEPIKHPDDRTDFRTHGREAEFLGPIVKEDFIDHCSGCDREHFVIHREQLVELYGSDNL